MKNDGSFAGLAGRVAIVTGAAGGIGSAAVHEFIRAGAQVVASDVSDAPASELESAGALFVRADVTKYDDVEGLVDAAVREYGRLDIFFGNAGAYSGRRAHSMPLDEYRHVVSVCMDGSFYAVRAAVPVMRRQRSGVFLFTASTAAVQGMPNSVAYSMAKHALIGLVQSIVIDYGSEGIRANAILPGPTATDMLTTVWGEEGPLHDVIVAATATKRLGEPDDQARVARFLVSDDAGFLTGTAIAVDGGMSSGQILLKEMMSRAMSGEA